MAEQSRPQRSGEQRRGSQHGKPGGKRGFGGQKRAGGGAGNSSRKGKGAGKPGGKFGDKPGGKSKKSNRGGFKSNRGGGGGGNRTQRTGPQRPGYREERLKARTEAPELPDYVSASDLDPSVLQDLRSLSKDNADKTARHMVAAALLVAEDPQLALAHARAAKDRAGRVGVARETLGVTAYHAGEWKEALSELRAARRMSGGPGLLAVMADCERGLGRPEKAIEIGRSEEVAQLDDDAKTELAIVVAGALRDLGRLDDAIAELETQDLDPRREDFEAVRLFYAYADALAAAKRAEDAIQWFKLSAALDPDEVLDSTERLDELHATLDGKTE